MFYNVKSGKFLIQHFSSNMHLFNLEATSEEDAYLGFIQLQMSLLITFLLQIPTLCILEKQSGFYYKPRLEASTPCFYMETYFSYLNKSLRVSWQIRSILLPYKRKKNRLVYLICNFHILSESWVWWVRNETEMLWLATKWNQFIFFIAPHL